MGTCYTGEIPSPLNNQNVCSDGYDQGYVVPHFCGKGYVVPHFCGKGYRPVERFCKILSPYEWTEAKQQIYSYCKMDTDEPFRSLDFNTDNYSGYCDNYGIGADGSRGRCQRTAFTADRLTCCFADLECNKTVDERFCFDGKKKYHTCDPNYRNMSSMDCKDTILPYCAGDDLPNSGTDPESGRPYRDIWLERWTSSISLPKITPLGDERIHSFDSPCWRAVWRNLYANQASRCVGAPITSAIPPNEDGYIWTRQLITKASKKYFAYNGTFLSQSPTKIPYPEFNSKIESLCRLYPGVCEPTLRSFCSSTTTELIRRRPELIKWCGCYMPNQEYSKYTDTYLIGKECTPTCNVAEAIPLYSTSGIGIKRCQQSFCVIDDLSIQIAKSRVGDEGGINFSQICSSCGYGTASCQCTITGNTIAIINSQIPSLNISQNCGSKSTCFKEEIKGDQIISTQVPCSSDGTYAEYSEVAEQSAENRLLSRQKSFIYTVLIILGVLLIIVIVWKVLLRYTLKITSKQKL